MDTKIININLKMYKQNENIIYFFGKKVVNLYETFF